MSAVLLPTGQSLRPHAGVRVYALSDEKTGPRPARRFCGRCDEAGSAGYEAERLQASQVRHGCPPEAVAARSAAAVPGRGVFATAR